VINVIQISPSGPLYEAERELRNRVLLRPIGVADYGWEQKDKDSLHFVALQNENVIGCVLLWLDPEDHKAAQLLQMAVHSKLQGQGVGRVMVETLLDAARSRDLQTVWCHARSNVIPFYAKLGFVTGGEVFQEVGLDHQVMEFQLKSGGTDELPDIETPEDVEKLVRAFYEKVYRDDLLSPIFIDIAGVKMEDHLPKMFVFWKHVILDVGKYEGNAYKVHHMLHRKAALEPHLFSRWLDLFRSNLDEHFQGPNVEKAMRAAKGIAESFQERLTMLSFMKPRSTEN
jgi:truncated hemoglobin YjbI/predicted GNAT family N-acyltransferase